MSKGNGKARIVSILLAIVMMLGLFAEAAWAQSVKAPEAGDEAAVPTAEVAAAAVPAAEVAAAAHWKFNESGVKSGAIAGGDLVIADATGNGNDLKMQLYMGKQLTDDANAANWNEYLSFSDGGMTGAEGSMAFNGDSASGEGADFVTDDAAPINRETFDGGYTIEAVYYFPEDWTTADAWMGLLARQADVADIGNMTEPELGSMSVAISNCKEIQYAATNAANSHRMASAAWSVSMDEGGVWYHIAITSDGETIRTYVNGCEAFRDYESGAMDGMFADPDKGQFRVGSSWWLQNGQTLDKFLHGSLQEIRISNGALATEDWLVPNPAERIGEYGSNEAYELKGEDNYNIVFIPDTQNTVKFKGEVMKVAIDGLVGSAGLFNVKGVVHLGDVVENADSVAQYETARGAFYPLAESGLPLLMQRGNHDGGGYAGAFGPDSAFMDSAGAYLFNDSPSANSSYMFVRAGSYRYLVISLGASNGTAWAAEDEAWFRGVLEKNPGCPTIVTSHDIQNCSDTAPSAVKLSSNGNRLWEIVSGYPQVFMLIGGHSHGAGHEILKNDAGKDVVSILADYQFAYNGGNGFFKYAEFSEADGRIYLRTYSPYAASIPEAEKTFFDVNFMTGPGNDDVISLDFGTRFAGMEIEPRETYPEDGRYMAGEYHAHTNQSKDATEPYMKLENVLGVAFRNPDIQNSGTAGMFVSDIRHGSAYDYLILADHLRNSKNTVDGFGAYDTLFYEALRTQYNAYRRMQSAGLYEDKIIYSGFEWDYPGRDHAVVGVIDSNSDVIPFEGIHEFEYRYARVSEGAPGLYDDEFDESAWGARQNPDTSGSLFPVTLDAIDWLKANYPESFMLINHPSRKNGGENAVTISDIRRMNDQDPSIVFGMEGMLGGQLDGVAAGMSGDHVRGRNDEMIAVTGGVWDSLLAEGRKFYNFANSDFHFKVSSNGRYASGYWPGEYGVSHTFVTPGEDGEADFRDVVDGMRSGNSYSVAGELISDLGFTISCGGRSATMGEDLVALPGSDAVVSIRFKIPEHNNYKSLYGADAKYGVTNEPSLDHIDLISGEVTGAVADSEYGDIQPGSADIIRTFTSADWGAPDEDGFYLITYALPAGMTDADRFFRIRGLSSDDVDENGDPKPDARVPEVSSNEERIDEINDFNYANLSFYANPIWLTTRVEDCIGVHAEAERTVFGDDAGFLISADGLDGVNLIAVEFEAEGRALGDEPPAQAALDGLSGFSLFSDLEWEGVGGGKYVGRAILGAYSGELKSGTMDVARLSVGASRLGGVSVKLTGVTVYGIDAGGGPAMSEPREIGIYPGLASSAVWSAYDVDGDNAVGYADLSLAFFFYLSKAGDANWGDAGRADVDADGDVDMTDLAAIYANFLA